MLNGPDGTLQEKLEYPDRSRVGIVDETGYIALCGSLSLYIGEQSA